MQGWGMENMAQEGRKLREDVTERHAPATPQVLQVLPCFAAQVSIRHTASWLEGVPERGWLARTLFPPVVTMEMNFR